MSLFWDLKLNKAAGGGPLFTRLPRSKTEVRCNACDEGKPTLKLSHRSTAQKANRDWFCDASSQLIFRSFLPPAKQNEVDESSFFDQHKHLYNDRSYKEATRNSGNVMEEIDGYLAKHCNTENEPLNFWKAHQKDYPQLARIARCFLSAPATSIASEGTFSEVRDVFGYKSSRLILQSAEMLIFLNKNLKSLPFHYRYCLCW